MCTTCVRYPQKPEEGSRSFGTVFSDGRVPLCGCWELNLGHLEEYPTLITAKPSLQALLLDFKNTFVSTSVRQVTEYKAPCER